MSAKPILPPRPPFVKPEPGPRRKLRREHWALAFTLTLLLLATVPPLINLGRFQHRIAGSVSRSVGRPIAFRSLSFRLLPWPALKIQDFAVDEDPRFGYEPALRAPEVTATPRLSSLWRGRFELARVELTNPSVNLVRNPDGRWSVGALLLQASRVPNAPTGQPRPGPAPRFPYIEATGARINLKRGPEKLPYSLVNADFSMSLASPNSYRLKLEGQPLRTDIAISANDTGTLRLEGDLQRASAFGAMPLSLRAEWKEASLGQLTQLLTGHDFGWRALVDASARLTGDLDHLSFRTRIVAANLHREEFTPDRTYTIDAVCQGLWSRSDPTVDAFRCRWPLGAGALTLAGSALIPTAGASAARSFEATLDRIPADVLAATAGLLRPNLPPPGLFEGELTGNFVWTPATGQLTGQATLPRLGLKAAEPSGDPVVLTHLQLIADSTGSARQASIAEPGEHGANSKATPAATRPASNTAQDFKPGRPAPVAAASIPALSLSADPLPLGPDKETLAISAKFFPRGWRVSTFGRAALPNLQALAAALRIPVQAQLSSTEEKRSSLTFDLSRSATWLNAEPPVTTGSLTLENTSWQPAWLPFPVQLNRAAANFTPGLARWIIADAEAGLRNQPVHLAGSAQIPLACIENTPCLTRFALQTPALDAAAFQSALTGNRPELVALLLRRFNSRTHLPAVTGTLKAAVLTLGKLPIRNAVALLSTTDEPASTLALHALDGTTLGGTLHMQGTLSLAGAAPLYRLHTELSGISAPQAAALWGESWGLGTLAASADLALSGITAHALLTNLSGNYTADWLNGAPPPLPRFARWDSSGTLTPEGLTLDHSSLADSLAAVSHTAVTGRIAWDRTLQLQLSPAPGAAPTPVNGSLARPLK